MYPLRITGPVEPPEAPGQLYPDMPHHYPLGPAKIRYGERVGGRSTGYLYKNEVEGGGAVSVGVPKRKGFLSTQREMVRSAQQRGEYVHPNIAWAAKHTPEHTAEEIVPRYHHETPAGMRIAPQQLPGVHAESEKMARTSYKTEGGKTQHVFRWRDSTPGSALNPVQWERGSTG